MPNDVGTEGALAARSVMVTDRSWDALRTMAFKERLSISEIIRDALEAYRPLKPYLGDAP
jgi:hypothetical protein